MGVLGGSSRRVGGGSTQCLKVWEEKAVEGMEFQMQMAEGKQECPEGVCIETIHRPTNEQVCRKRRPI